jgi:hypothetical protein
MGEANLARESKPVRNQFARKESEMEIDRR